MGIIGDNKIFCASTACSIQKHETNNFSSSSGLYIRVPKKPEQCFTSPFLADNLLDAPLLEMFLTAEKTVDEWSSIFAQITTANVKFTADSWAAVETVRLRAKVFQTPKKTSTIPKDTRQQFKYLGAQLEDIKIAIDDAHETTEPTFEIRISTLELQMKHLGLKFTEWINAQAEEIDELQDNLEDMNSRLIDLESAVGRVPPIVASQVEPTLWDTIASLVRRPLPVNPFSSIIWTKTLNEFKSLQTSVLNGKRASDDFQNALVQLCRQFKSDIQHLDQQIRSAKSDFSTKLTSSSTASLFGSIQDSSQPQDFEDSRQNYSDALSKLEQLNESVKSFSASNIDGSHEGVDIGDLKFPHQPDLKVWVEDNLKALNFPFGVFLDVYSFLGRIQSGYTLEDGAQHMLKGLDLNQRISITSDETTTLSSFMFMVPTILGRAGSGNSALSSTKTTFLPALRSKDDWENPTRNGGVKHVIEDQMPNVLYQMKDLITTRLRGNSQAIMLATTCLSISHSFVVDLCRFISDTHRDLHMAGFPPTSSWLLVTKLVVRIFGTDLDKVRAFMRGKMDTTDHACLATDALWATLRTISIMQEYMKHGIENHPAISAEYVRFLVSNSALGSISRVESQLKVISTKLDEVATQAKAAQSSASAAVNKAYEAARAAGVPESGKSKKGPT